MLVFPQETDKLRQKGDREESQVSDLAGEGRVRSTLVLMQRTPKAG